MPAHSQNFGSVSKGTGDGGSQPSQHRQQYQQHHGYALAGVPAWTPNTGSGMDAMPQYMMGSQHLTTTNNHKWGTKESNRQLSLELHQFGAYVSGVDEQSRPVIDHMITLLQKAVTKACPGAVLESYGSYATGLWLPTSDVDMVVHLPVQLYDANQGNLVNESSKRGTSEENDGTQSTVSDVANAATSLLVVHLLVAGSRWY